MADISELRKVEGSAEVRENYENYYCERGYGAGVPPSFICHCGRDVCVIEVVDTINSSCHAEASRYIR